jgi:DNA-binding response OmpR family regulator
MGSRILVLDDEADFRSGLVEYLEMAGYLAEGLEGAWQLDLALASKPPAELLVMDVNMPGEDGRSALMRLRATSELPVILMSGRADAIDRIVALELGADDVLSKPFDPRELVARIEALLRRARGSQRAHQLRFEQATADLAHARLLHDDGRIERLSAGEVALLRVLSRDIGAVFDREQLIEEAPGEDEDALARAIDSRINRLRGKLKTDGILTLRGAGYRLDPARVTLKPALQR